MDNWYLIFYLFSLVDKISIVFGTLTILSAIWGAITFITLLNCSQFDESDWQRWRKSFFWALPIFIFSISLWTFTPNRKELLIIIAGGSVGNFITTDENAKAIPSEITKFLRTEIQNATEETINSFKKEKLRNLTKEELIKRLNEKEGQ